MKRPSFRNNRFERVSLLSTNVRSLGIIILVVVLLLGAIRLIWPGAFVAMVSPLWGAGSLLTNGVGAVGDSFGNTHTLTEDRDRLIEENAALTAELATLKAERADEARLESTQGILAGVIARPPVASYDVLILAAGTKQGVTEGHIVYGNGGVPIGTIRDVTADTSRAALFSEAGRESHGWVGEERVPVVLVGKGSGIFGMTVAKDAGLVVGNVVYLPGPGAAAVGIVSRIETDPSTPDATVYVFPYANPFALSSVRIGPALLP